MSTIINQSIVDFKVQAFHDGKFKTVTRADVLGKWAVFFFYPADFTFVCPTELGELADKYAQFKELGVEVFSVSTATHFTHKAWYDASPTIKKIKFPMLADPTGVLSRAFGDGNASVLPPPRLLRCNNRSCPHLPPISRNYRSEGIL